jgi:hypothetical protein
MMTPLAESGRAPARDVVVKVGNSIGSEHARLGQHSQPMISSLTLADRSTPPRRRAVARIPFQAVSRRRTVATIARTACSYLASCIVGRERPRPIRRAELRTSERPRPTVALGVGDAAYSKT